METKFERSVIFQPAFDKRNPNPKKNYGIHSVQCLMILIGKKGATHFTFSTGMLLSKTMDEYIEKGIAKYEKLSFGSIYLNKPLGFDVGYHSPKPIFKYQTISKEKCDWIGVPCYCDGSALAAEPMLDLLIEKGSEEVWKKLEAEYHEIFDEQK